MNNKINKKNNKKTTTFDSTYFPVSHSELIGSVHKYMLYTQYIYGDNENDFVCVCVRTIPRTFIRNMFSLDTVNWCDCDCVFCTYICMLYVCIGTAYLSTKVSLSLKCSVLRLFATPPIIFVQSTFIAMVNRWMSMMKMLLISTVFFLFIYFFFRCSFSVDFKHTSTLLIQNNKENKANKRNFHNV